MDQKISAWKLREFELEKCSVHLNSSTYVVDTIPNTLTYPL